MISLLLTLPLLLAMPDEGSAMRFNLDDSERIQNPFINGEPNLEKTWQRNEVPFDSEANRPFDATNNDWHDIQEVETIVPPFSQSLADDLYSNIAPSVEKDTIAENNPRNDVGSLPIIHRHYQNLVPTVSDPFAMLPKEHAFGYNLKQSSEEINSTQRIVGGSYARSIRDFPYQVALKDNGDQFCGGTIIHYRWIGCAAHCFERQLSYFYVTGGALLRSSGGQDFAPQRVVIHPQWDYPSFRNDLALIQLKVAMQFNENMQYLSMPGGPVPDNAPVTVSGWGLDGYPNGRVPDNLKFASLTSYNVYKCRDALRGTGIMGQSVSEANVCTFNPYDASCKGDSGGPLMYNYWWSGAVSWGVACLKGYPDVYTSIFYYRGFINSVVGSY